jgi:hypothetical protein
VAEDARAVTLVGPTDGRRISLLCKLTEVGGGVAGGSVEGLVEIDGRWIRV